MWELVFYCLRCGKIKVAIDILVHNKPQLALLDESNNILKALKILDNCRQNSPSSSSISSSSLLFNSSLSYSSYSLNVNDVKVFSDLQTYLSSLIQKQEQNPYLYYILLLLLFN